MSLTPFLNQTASFSASLDLAGSNLVDTKKSTDLTLDQIKLIEGYRIVVVLALFALPAAFLILLMYGLITRQSIGIKRHVVAVIPTWGLFQIVSLLAFVIAVAVGDSCYYVLENRQSTNQLALLTGVNLNDILNVKDSCANNTSILSVANKLNLTSSNMMVTDYMNTALSSSNFSIIFDKISISYSIYL